MPSVHLNFYSNKHDYQFDENVLWKDSYKLLSEIWTLKSQNQTAYKATATYTYDGIYEEGNKPSDQTFTVSVDKDTGELTGANSIALKSSPSVVDKISAKDLYDLTGDDVNSDGKSFTVKGVSYTPVITVKEDVIETTKHDYQFEEHTPEFRVIDGSVIWKNEMSYQGATWNLYINRGASYYGDTSVITADYKYYSGASSSKTYIYPKLTISTSTGKVVSDETYGNLPSYSLKDTGTDGVLWKDSITYTEGVGSITASYTLKSFTQTSYMATATYEFGSSKTQTFSIKVDKDTGTITGDTEYIETSPVVDKSTTVETPIHTLVSTDWDYSPNGFGWICNGQSAKDEITSETKTDLTYTLAYVEFVDKYGYTTNITSFREG